MHVSVCGYVHMRASAHSGQEEALGPPELELYMVINHPSGVMETELRSYSGAVKASNH